MDQSQVNIAMMMLPKVSTVVLCETDTVRQGLEVMRHHGYTAIPVLDKAGAYLGSVTEGDFLRHLIATGTTDFKMQEQYQIREIFRRNFCKPLPICAPLSELVAVSLEQNFIPIVDDRSCLCGIVTRRSLIAYLYK
ncbi:MAG: CBS domain-containing protein [Eubacteriales bacterium]|nr:CBS domain-containing protein [Eubacteriales bacterium]